jgi:large subunit ribosomal protein L21
MYAIVVTGGKQYRVEEGQSIRVEKINAADGAEVVLDQVLAVSKDGQLTVGSPTVAGAKVVATVKRTAKGPKIQILKFKHKVNYRKRQGHRQPFTELVISKIEA